MVAFYNSFQGHAEIFLEKVQQQPDLYVVLDVVVAGVLELVFWVSGGVRVMLRSCSTSA